MAGPMAPMPEAAPPIPVETRQALAGLAGREGQNLRGLQGVDARGDATPEKAVADRLAQNRPGKTDVLQFLEQVRAETSTAPITKGDLDTMRRRMGAMVAQGGALENQDNPQRRVADSVAERGRRAVRQVENVLDYTKLRRLMREEGMDRDRALAYVLNEPGPDGQAPTLRPDQLAQADELERQMRENALHSISENPVFRRLLPDIINLPNGQPPLTPEELLNHIDNTIAASPHLESALNKHLAHARKEMELLADVQISPAERQAQQQRTEAAATLEATRQKVLERIGTAAEPINDVDAFNAEMTRLLSSPNLTTEQLQTSLMDAYLRDRGVNGPTVRTLIAARGNRNRLNGELQGIPNNAANTQRRQELQTQISAAEQTIRTAEQQIGAANVDTAINTLTAARDRMTNALPNAADNKTMIALTQDLITSNSALNKAEQVIQTESQAREGVVQQRLRTESDLADELEGAMSNAIIDVMYRGAQDAALAIQANAAEAAANAQREGRQAEAQAQYAVERAMAEKWIEWSADPDENPIVNESSILEGMRYLAFCGKTGRAEEAVPRMMLGDLVQRGIFTDAFYNDFRDANGALVLDRVNMHAMPENDRRILDQVVAAQGGRYLARLVGDFRTGQQGFGLNAFEGAARRIGIKMGRSEWALDKNNPLYDGLVAFEPQLMESIKGDERAVKVMNKLRESGMEPKMRIQWLLWLLGGVGLSLLTLNPAGAVVGAGGALGALLGGGAGTAGAVALGGIGAAGIAGAREQR